MQLIGDEGRGVARLHGRLVGGNATKVVGRFVQEPRASELDQTRARGEVAVSSNATQVGGSSLNLHLTSIGYEVPSL